MSRDGTLPPGVEHCDIPGWDDADHDKDCAWHEDNEHKLDDAGCTCAQIIQDARADAEEAKFEESRGN
jgi:hypothetical protein